jgi:hypothetical protein
MHQQVLKSFHVWLECFQKLNRHVLVLLYFLGKFPKAEVWCMAHNKQVLFSGFVFGRCILLVLLYFLGKFPKAEVWCMAHNKQVLFSFLGYGRCILPVPISSFSVS